MVIFDASAAKNGIRAREIERRYGLTPRAAWHLMLGDSNSLRECCPAA
jgi:hypothetical protein